MMHSGMEWFEDQTGFDLTPCHDADGTWNPGPSCGGFPLTPNVTHGTWNNIGGSNSGSGSGTQGLGQTGGFADPDHTVNIDGPATFDYTHQVKLEGTYRVPAFGGFNLSGVYNYTTGAAYGRTAVFRGLPGTETVRVGARGTLRNDPLNNFDLRVEKTFPLGAASRTGGVYLDVFNVNNQGVADSASRTGVIESSGPNYGNPNVWISPRLLRLGFRFTW